MERQNRLLTISFIILLALIVLLFIDNKQNGGKKHSDDPNAVETHELVDYKPEEVVTVTVQNGSAEAVKFEKSTGEWTMVAPKQVAIDASKVAEIVDRLDPVLVEERTLTGDPAGYGLDAQNRAQVTLGAADGRSWTVWVGKETTVGFGTYVQTAEGGPVGVAQKHLSELVHRGMDDFRSKTVWTISSGTAHRVVISRGEERVVLRKDDHGWWLGDEGPRVDESAVKDWLQKADLLRADSFEDSGMVELKPVATLTIEDADGTHTLSVGDGDTTGVLVKGDGPLVRVPATANDLVKLTGWPGTTLMEVRKFQVDSIAMKLGDYTAKWVKADGVWKDADGKPSARPEGLLDMIERTHGDRSAVPPGATSGWGSITLSESASGTPRSESLTFGDAVTTGEFAARVARDAAGGPAFTVLQADLDVLTGVARGTLPAPPPEHPPGPAGMEGLEGLQGIEGLEGLTGN
jgi:hypothetical protein